MASTSSKPGFWKPGSSRPGSSVDRVEAADETVLTSLAGSSSYNSATSKTRKSSSLASSSSSSLPVARSRNAILYHVETHQVTIIVAETGSGKTTQIPRYLYEAGWAPASSSSSSSFDDANHGALAGSCIAVTQPRRISAVSSATRVASELGTTLGQEVGYTVRFEDLSSPTATRIRYMTDGMLLRECMRDPLLTRYSVIMVDEAHERGANSDLLLGILAKIARQRPELRIIITSATIDAAAFRDFFSPNLVASHDSSGSSSSSAKDKHGKCREQTQQKDQVGILHIEGRVFPVQIAYLDAPCQDYLESAVSTVLEIDRLEPPGDILVFVTGRNEVDAVLQMLADSQLDYDASEMDYRSGTASFPREGEGRAGRGGGGGSDRHGDRSSNRLELLPLHAGISASEAAAVFAPPSRRMQRKVIIATNIAETGVTIDGVVYVVDTGLVKLRVHSAATTGEDSTGGGGSAGRSTLSLFPISRASARQRAGRAGRTAPGKCYRLYTEEYFATEMQETTRPELSRMDLLGPVLTLKALGVDNLVRFGWVPPSPSPLSLSVALAELYTLGAIDADSRLTTKGERMAELPPFDPRLAAVLLNCTSANSKAKTIPSKTQEENKCEHHILSIIAMLQVESPFFAPDSPATQLAQRQFAAQQGDLLTLLNVWLAWFAQPVAARPGWSRKNRISHNSLNRALSIRGQLSRFLQRFRMADSSASARATTEPPLQPAYDTKQDGWNTDKAADGDDSTPLDVAVRKLLLTGLYPNLARWSDVSMSYTLLDGTQAHPHPTSVFFNRRPQPQPQPQLQPQTSKTMSTLTSSAPAPPPQQPDCWVFFVSVEESLSASDSTPTQAEKSKQGRPKLYIRDLTVIDEIDWIKTAAPGYFDFSHSRARGP
ncbi:P-loop containing nucleoside triphosphate hydrolase protein [Testicularia cyperi]|uniref:RNA helicase n=1 Tax=Testicularia cyperi TaxID=1882483 RepID=A0A317XTU1_9BASI|nr:P-loop containing nucleoside triphosphate hydrolase protein [Testicularia cyperi]